MKGPRQYHLYGALPGSQMKGPRKYYLYGAFGSQMKGPRKYYLYAADTPTNSSVELAEKLTNSGVARPESMMTFEGAQHQGPEAIVQKLVSLPFQKVQHVVTTVDCQPTVDFGVLVMVVGQLKTDEDPIHGFSQTFILKNDGSNYYVLSDIFRLVVHSA
ncbi:Nuclear transport factor 2 [Branchiostoma belcheri]|nr:Nuclear transport factor 2 [Branchiostoma belcheri]